MPAHRKRFCKNGHDTWIVGRLRKNNTGGCNACFRVKRKRQHKEHCKRGHLIAEVGRNSSRQCNQCYEERIAQPEYKRRVRARYLEKIGGQYADSRRTLDTGRSPICVNGHDTRIVGRTPGRGCAECARRQKPNGDRKYRASHTEQRRRYRKTQLQRRTPKPGSKQFCKRGHDRFIVGITLGNGTCAECARENTQRNRKPYAVRLARNPERLRAAGIRHMNRRRARKLALPIIPYDAAAIRNAATHCGICKRLFVAGEKRVIDHILPLARGGGDTPDNVQAAHRICNESKGQRTVEQHRIITFAALGVAPDFDAHILAT